MISLLVPSKTFFVGEYLALKEGEALVACTKPLFQFKISKASAVTGENACSLYPGSANHHFYEKNKISLKKTSLVFEDPHLGQGGFGASGAKFVALHFLMQPSSAKKLDPFLLRESLLQNTLGGVLPSGYDVMAQAVGGLAHIHVENQIANGLSWPFPDIEFAIVRTENKLNTHEHLSNLPPFKSQELAKISCLATKAYKSADHNFFKLVKLYYEELVSQGLILKSSQMLLETIMQKKDLFISGKTCGAAGADTLLFFYHRKKTKMVESYFKKINKNIVYQGNQFSLGAHKVSLANLPSEVI